MADVAPVFKKKDNDFLKITDKYLSVLPTVSKIFKRIMQKQVTDYIGKFLSPFVYGYRKGFSTQYALLSLIGRWRLCLDKQGLTGTLLMHLSNIFDTFSHKLLKAKLHVYWFFIEALEITYKKGGKESWSRRLLVLGLDYFKRVPQESLHDPTLFNICVNDLFLH